MIEVETPQEIEVVSNGIDVEARSLDVEVVDLKELDVTVAKREFVITGDDIYVPKLYEDAPQWMKDLVQIVVNSAVDTGNASTLAQLASMLSQFATSYVPLNQYTQSILDLSNANTSIHSVIETLDSNYNNGLSQANAQILSLQNTKASKDEVVTQVVNTLAAQLANPTSSLGAAIGNLQQTIVNNQNANALSMQTLTTSLEDVSGNVSSNAAVINNALAYVGINSAGASTGTGLSAYVQGSNGVIGGADSKVANNVYVDAQGNNYSKWAYNSTVSLNGVNYSSGFGLSNSTGTGIGSEFWIDASRLRFTNAAKTGSKAPFTIDASGSTPQITFNGIVSFSNVTGYTPPDISGSINSNNDVFAQKLGYANYAAMVSAAASGQTVINGGYINTGLIQAGAITANQINTTGLMAKNITADEIVGKTLTGAVINGARINGAVVKASYLDLDGQLQVLTNYHISTAMYNANPSLYSDAVYLSADGEYRIPSISTVKENDRSSTTKNNTIYGSIRSYNTANAGNNNKAVKIRPYFIISEDVILFSCTGTLGDGYYANKGCNISLGSISLLMIMFNANSLILTVNGTSYSLDSATNGHSKSVTITIYGFVFQVNAGEVHSGGLYGFASSFVNVTLKQNSGFFLGTDFNSTSNGFKIQDTTSHAGDTSVNCSLSSAISINNMI